MEKEQDKRNISKCMKILREGEVEVLQDLMQEIYDQEKMPGENIKPLYKDKGDIQNFENYLGTELMSLTVKI